MRTIFLADGLKLATGVLFWSVALSFGGCISPNLKSRIEGLWLKELNPHLVKNLIGEVAFRSNDHSWSCGSYLYKAIYRPDPAKAGREVKIDLTSLIDVSTWKQAGDERVTIASTMIPFEDAKHDYLYVGSSEGEVLWVYDK